MLFKNESNTYRLIRYMPKRGIYLIVSVKAGLASFWCNHKLTFVYKILGINIWNIRFILCELSLCPHHIELEFVSIRLD